MRDNPHFAGPVVGLGAPLASARAVVILLHGRQQSPAYMEEQVVRRIDLPEVSYVAPTAADASWYPAGFMAPFADNEPRLGQALARVAALCTPRAVPQVVMGFSQGACLGCELVHRRPAAIDALVAFTGGLIGPPGTRWPDHVEGFAGMPVLLGGGSHDSWVPAARMEETAEVFRRLGANVRFHLYPDLGHEVGADQISHARTLLAELIGR